MKINRIYKLTLRHFVESNHILALWKATPAQVADANRHCLWNKMINNNKFRCRIIFRQINIEHSEQIEKK